jgi:hypothetical protein
MRKTGEDDGRPFAPLKAELIRTKDRLKAEIETGTSEQEYLPNSRSVCNEDN